MSEITFVNAFKVFAKELRKDKELYYSYQSNIAMAFNDEVRRKNHKYLSNEKLHEVSNTAAKNFLNLLIREV